MKIVVRDDFMDPVLYTEIAFYYEDYLRILYEHGGYCFKEQFIEYILQSTPSITARKAERVYSAMVDRKLIVVKSIVRSCYIYLGFNAMKYFTLKDEDQDFSEVPSRNLSVRRLDKRPSDRVLLFSAIKLQNFIDHHRNYTKNKLLEDSKKAFSLIFSEHKNSLANYKKVLAGDSIETSSAKVNHAVKVHTTYHDLSKIFFHFSFSDDEGVFINVHIVDISMREAPKMAMHIARGILDMGLSLNLSNADYIRGIELEFHTIAQQHKLYLEQVKKSLSNYILHNIFGDRKHIPITTNYHFYENLSRILQQKDSKKCNVKEKHEDQIQDIKKRLVEKSKIKGGESYS